MVGSGEAENADYLMRFNGLGNQQHGFRWCQRAAEQDCLDAINTLGWYYDIGFGVERDHHQAYIAYLKAAEFGHAKAQFNLAKMLATGRGVDYDPNEAAKWARNAAENNIKYAATLIASFYRDGVLSDHDDDMDTEAYYWYKKAAEEGAEWAKVLLGEMESGHSEPFHTYSLEKLRSL